MPPKRVSIRVWGKARGYLYHFLGIQAVVELCTRSVTVFGCEVWIWRTTSEMDVQGQTVSYVKNTIAGLLSMVSLDLRGNFFEEPTIFAGITASYVP